MFLCLSRRIKLEFGFTVLLLLCIRRGQAECRKGCHLAMASYFVLQGSDLTTISNIFSKEIKDILPYNKDIKNPDNILSGTRLNIPFSCDCINGDFLGHTFTYITQFDDTYKNIAARPFANLTTWDWIRSVNIYDQFRIPDFVPINVTVNCSCGDRSISTAYGLFTTYPLRPDDNLSFVAAESGVSEQLLQLYNPGVDFSQGSGLVFVPARAGISGGAIAGISVAGVSVALLLMGICIYVGVSRRKKKKASPLTKKSKSMESVALVGGASPGLTGISLDKSVEFSYEELAKATNDFSIANKIGQGGFGIVYYAELRGEKAAIKKMDMEASKEFLAELKVLTHVHHLNLVRLIGYCVEGSLFLVYEFIENGNLSQHLRGSGGEPLPWPMRVQIALDSARGLEYIHEHTVPLYIHRDIKSANILIDKNFHAKVADFGLTKLTEVGNSSLPTRLVGTFGYMPPEYAQYGTISPKIDVYAFGVVIYELISAMEAVVKTTENIAESRGLIALMFLCSSRRIKLELVFIVLLLLCIRRGEAECSKGCNLAMASYFVLQGSDLTNISNIFSKEIKEILPYNKDIKNPDNILSGTRINIPFSCDCINGDFLGHTFTYTTQFGDTYEKIAARPFANLTTGDWIRNVNIYDQFRIPDFVPINVTVNCSCGDRSISTAYGLFTTYPLRPDDNLTFVAAESGVSEQLLQMYNPGVDFSQGSGLVFVPARGRALQCHLLLSFQAGISGGAIAGISVAGVSVALLLMGICIYVGVSRRKKMKKASLLPAAGVNSATQPGFGTGSPLTKKSKSMESVALVGGASPGLTGISLDKSVEFSYEELAKATNDFSIANKIGQGGFGIVYYAELRGEKAAIKKMDMEASKEFLAELKVLTHVHHLNLVRLIGYCVEGSLFLVYEFIENGNLSQHLRGSGGEPLPWPMRVQIALDSARGLEYIHEHTVPLYIHRDIKSANILIDKNFHAKVADFGLTKLTEVGNSSLPTRLVGTFGYMPPEYAQYGTISPKIDVYAFGVVIYELISAMEAVVKTTENIAESRGLIALFEDVLNRPDPRDDLRMLVDPKLGDNYPLDSVLKMAQLAKACTQENPQLRPSMRSIVVALMTLSSTTEDWDVGSFYDNQAHLVNLVSGR
ncbi:Protein kinase domain [Macleaya cordata]|uniref:non-specific serine/threonine protein kinase n=1 Tax=Macleaya cordata TaxID=56857 RepID=A0A200QGX1_MACCD|nr:Protein kinase domain [Macleaya cordata]